MVVSSSSGEQTIDAQTSALWTRISSASVGDSDSVATVVDELASLVDAIGKSPAVSTKRKLVPKEPVHDRTISRLLQCAGVCMKKILELQCTPSSSDCDAFCSLLRSMSTVYLKMCRYLNVPKRGLDNIVSQCAVLTNRLTVAMNNRVSPLPEVIETIQSVAAFQIILRHHGAEPKTVGKSDPWWYVIYAASHLAEEGCSVLRKYKEWMSFACFRFDAEVAWKLGCTELQKCSQPHRDRQRLCNPTFSLLHDMMNVFPERERLSLLYLHLAETLRLATTDQIEDTPTTAMDYAHKLCCETEAEVDDLWLIFAVKVGVLHNCVTLLQSSDVPQSCNNSKEAAKTQYDWLRVGSRLQGWGKVLAEVSKNFSATMEALAAATAAPLARNAVESSLLIMHVQRSLASLFRVSLYLHRYADAVKVLNVMQKHYDDEHFVEIRQLVFFLCLELGCPQEAITYLKRSVGEKSEQTDHLWRRIILQYRKPDSAELCAIRTEIGEQNTLQSLTKHVLQTHIDLAELLTVDPERRHVLQHKAVYNGFQIAANTMMNTLDKPSSAVSFDEVLPHVLFALKYSTSAGLALQDCGVSGFSSTINGAFPYFKQGLTLALSVCSYQWVLQFLTLLLRLSVLAEQWDMACVIMKELLLAWNIPYNLDNCELTAKHQTNRMASILLKKIISNNLSRDRLAKSFQIDDSLLLHIGTTILLLLKENASAKLLQLLEDCKTTWNHTSTCAGLVESCMLHFPTSMVELVTCSMEQLVERNAFDDAKKLLTSFKPWLKPYKAAATSDVHHECLLLTLRYWEVHLSLVSALSDATSEELDELQMKTSALSLADSAAEKHINRAMSTLSDMYSVTSVRMFYPLHARISELLAVLHFKRGELREAAHYFCEANGITFRNWQTLIGKIEQHGSGEFISALQNLSDVTNWSFIQLHLTSSLISTSGHRCLFIVKFIPQCADSPFVHCIGRFTPQEVQHSTYLEDLFDSIADSFKTINKSTELKAAREKQDSSFIRRLDRFEHKFLKKHCYLLRGSPVDRLVLARLRASLEKRKVHLSTAVLHAAWYQWHARKSADDEVAKLLTALTRLTTSQIQTATSLISKAGAKATEVNSHPVVMALHHDLASIPIESLDCMYGQGLTRMPSLRFALDLHAALAMTKPAVSDQPTFYVLDPTNELPDIVSRFSWFSKMNDWSGLIGEPPSREILRKRLEDSSIFIYCGHGSGSQYLGSLPTKLDAQTPASLLMGCSSARLYSSPSFFFEPLCYAIIFLLTGSAAIVGNLFAVEDKDINIFTERLLRIWLDRTLPLSPKHVASLEPNSDLSGAVALSRDHCRLKMLTGAAPVVYGLPVHATRNDAL